MSEHPAPDPDVCLWWDWKQPCGRVVRIRYMPTWKHDYPWHSVERAYPQSTIDSVGGRFVPVPLSW